MHDFSEEAIRENCPHCDPTSFALKYPLTETQYFWVVCDVHPITSGHILIIPKQHLAGIGEYPQDVYKQFLDLFGLCSRFLCEKYGAVSSFEHGRLGQSVFHSHVHLFPFTGQPEEVIPEGPSHWTHFKSMSELHDHFLREGGYLFFAIDDHLWLADPALVAPRFFRDRFATLLKHPERGDWKQMHENSDIMDAASQEISELQSAWRGCFSDN